MAVYIVQVPHLQRPSVIVGEDQDDLIDRLAQHASRGGDIVETWGQAVDHALDGMHGGAAYLSDAEAVDAIRTGAGLPEHQHLAAIGALREALDRRDVLPPGLTPESA